MDEGYCQELSLEVGEPLAGTAVASTDRFILLEHDGPWGPRGIEDSGLPEAVATHLAELASRHARVRVQLVRKPRPSASGVRLFCAEVDERGGRLFCTTLASLDALPGRPLAAWLEGVADPPGERALEPHYFVCVHGKRDRCCARLGMPVYKALEDLVGERAYQTTHLGGHRFAATLLVLPSGVCYGRVPSAEAPALVRAADRGEIYDLERVRGRTSYPSAAQAAEVKLRQQLEQGSRSSLSLLACEERGDQSVVRFRDGESGREHEVEVRTAALEAAPASCGAKPKIGQKLVASLLR